MALIFHSEHAAESIHRELLGKRGINSLDNPRYVLHLMAAVVEFSSKTYEVYVVILFITICILLLNNV